MKFVVFGASGMAGHLISLYLKERGHDIIGFSRRGVPFLNCQVIGDVCDESLVRSTISDTRPDVVINCIGVLNRFAEADPKGAAYLNGEFPHLLARTCEGSHTRVFHMSTDCVFAGNSAPYTEDSVPDGKSVYDRTKAAGELNDGVNLTFRNSVVGPDMNPKGIGLFNWFMAQEGPVDGFTNAVWTGLTTLELARAMESAAYEHASGLVNMVPEGNISKYELLLLFNEYFRGGSIEVTENPSFVLDKTLVRTNFDLSFRPAGYVQQVREMAEWVHAHYDLYPHYMLGQL